jgi:hypothetical protein
MDRFARARTLATTVHNLVAEKGKDVQMHDNQTSKA